MIRTTPPGPRRSGFTLIELLVVVSIIAVLAALGAGAYFRVRVSQQEKATETTLGKLQSELDLQWRSIIDNCKEDYVNGSISSAAISLAGETSANRRSLVIWTKMKMKAEFPQNFYEAVVWPTTVQGIQVKSSFYRPLAAAGVKALDPNNPTNAAVMTPTRQLQESAVLFYIALTQGRRGNVKFNPNEHLGPHAVGQIALAPDPNNPGVTANFNVFMDSWGNPIYFIRWPLGMATTTDLNLPPYQQLNASNQPCDPGDPERTFYDADWAGSTLPNALTSVMGYATQSPPLVPPLLTNPNPPLNLTAVIFSAGRDGIPGIDAFYGIDPSAPAGSENDNVYAYRVKGPGRGNN